MTYEILTPTAKYNQFCRFVGTPVAINVVSRSIKHSHASTVDHSCLVKNTHDPCYPVHGQRLYTCYLLQLHISKSFYIVINNYRWYFVIYLFWNCMQIVSGPIAMIRLCVDYYCYTRGYWSHARIRYAAYSIHATQLSVMRTHGDQYCEQVLCRHTIGGYVWGMGSSRYFSSLRNDFQIYYILLRITEEHDKFTVEGVNEVICSQFYDYHGIMAVTSHQSVLWLGL